MLSAVLANSDAFQVGYPLALLPVSTVLSAWYTDWRAKRAPQPLMGGGVSVTQALHVHHHHHHHHSRGSGGGRKPRGRLSWLDRLSTQETIGVIIAIGLGVMVLTWLIARVYVRVRGDLLLALLMLASISAGTALGAFLALRRYDWFDRSWRWPVAATALIAVIGGVDVYLLAHPAFATGDYGEVLTSVSRQDWVLKDAFLDVDANVFLFYQAIAAVLALLTVASSLILVLGLWAAIEERVGLRPGFIRRAARRTVQRLVDSRWLSGALLATALFSAITSAGWSYNGIRYLQGIGDDSGPTVSELSADAGRRTISLRMTIDEPVRLLVRVRRGGDGSRATRRFELRPGRRRVLVYGRADRGPLREGRYRVFIVIRDEAGNASRRERVLRIRAGTRVKRRVR